MVNADASSVGLRYLAHNQQPQPVAQLCSASAAHHIMRRIRNFLQSLICHSHSVILQKDMRFPFLRLQPHLNMASLRVMHL